MFFFHDFRSIVSRQGLKKTFKRDSTSQIDISSQTFFLKGPALQSRLGTLKIVFTQFLPDKLF